MNACQAERLRSPSIQSRRRSGPKRGSLGAVGDRLRGWLWAPILAKMLFWLGTFVGLSFIGSGAAARILGAMPWQAAESAAAPSLPPHAPEQTGQGIASDSERGHCQRPDAGRGPGDAAAGPRKPSAVTDDGRVVLNVAGEGDLTRLPGIGPKRAQAILELREQLGRFQRLEQLLRVRGIGRRTLRRLRPLVVLDPPAPASAQGEASADASADPAPGADG